MWPLVVIILSGFTLPTWCETNLDVSFNPSELKNMKMSEVAVVNFTTTDLTTHELENGIVYFYSRNLGVATVNPEYINLTNIKKSISLNNNVWSSAFNVTANFIGFDEVEMAVRDGKTERLSKPVVVTVIRTKRLVDTIFVVSIIILMSIVFINFGCALDFQVIRESLRRPVGPGIGCVTQFIFMPLISFFLGQLFFANSVAMQLGFFFTGISPGGGASNVWTIVLRGNMNLSLTMTTISTLAAFFMMPFWAFTLGRVIFHSGSLVVPYSKISQSAVSLLIPLLIGFAIQKYYPKVSRQMANILKPLSALVIIFIIVFATATNLYLFQLFTWQIVVAGFGLPFFGYLSGAILARAFKVSLEDVIAISVETGVQNTGIAIFMLQFSLEQPEADLTTVAPVAVAVLTPVPLMCLYVVQRLCGAKKITT